MTKAERVAIMTVYERINKLTGQIPSNPCDIVNLARFSRACDRWLPRCMNALSEIVAGEPTEALDMMEGS